MTVDVDFIRMNIQTKRKLEKARKKSKAKFKQRRMSRASTIFRAGDLVKLSDEIRVEDSDGDFRWFMEGSKLMIVSANPDWIKVLIAGRLYSTTTHNISKFNLCPIGK